MKRFFKIFLTSLLVIFLLLQLYPRQNTNRSSGITASDITSVHAVPNDVQQLLRKSCYDCHSNNTDYPWYSKIQPLSLWLTDHIETGKSELNFSIFGTYSLRRQFHKLEEIDELVMEGEMPLNSYTIIHREAALTMAQRQTISTWCRSLRDSFTANYHPDSLKQRPKR